MMATPFSGGGAGLKFRCGWFFGVACFLWFAFGSIPVIAQSKVTETSSPTARLQRLYLEAQGRWQTNTNEVEIAWSFGRACFQWADLATNDTQRAAVAGEGIAACRRAIELQPKSAPAHYYLGLNLGQVARTKYMGALKLVGEMEAVWLKTIELDADFNYAGGCRSLGLLYRDTPGWPVSIGNRKKARELLQKAADLHPEYPGNRLNLLEAKLKWGEKRDVQAQTNAVETALQKARVTLTGERWSLEWQDWNQQWEEIKKKAAVVETREPVAGKK